MMSEEIYLSSSLQHYGAPRFSNVTLCPVLAQRFMFKIWCNFNVIVCSHYCNFTRLFLFKSCEISRHITVNEIFLLAFFFMLLQQLVELQLEWFLRPFMQVVSVVSFEKYSVQVQAVFNTFSTVGLKICGNACITETLTPEHVVSQASSALCGRVLPPAPSCDDARFVSPKQMSMTTPVICIMMGLMPLDLHILYSSSLLAVLHGSKSLAILRQHDQALYRAVGGLQLWKAYH